MALKRTYLITLLLIMVQPFHSSAQKFGSRSISEKDSISKMLELAIEENAKIFADINAANAIIKSQPQKALGYLENALRLSFKNANKRGEAYSYYSLGAVNYSLNKYIDAENYFLKSRKLLLTLKDDSALFDLHRYLGLTYEAQNKSTLAIQQYRQYLSKVRRFSESNQEFSVRNHLARVLYNSKNYSSALENYRYIESHDPKFDKASLYENIGKCYTGLKDTTNAIKYFKLSDQNSPNRIGGTWSARYYENVSNSYKQVARSDQYFDYQKKAKTKNRKDKNYRAEVQNNVNIANELLLNDKAKSAIPYIKESIDLSKLFGELKETGEAYAQLTEAYEKIGETEKARASFEKYKEINLSILAEKEAKINEKLNEQSQFFEKEKEIALLVKEKELDSERIALLEQKQKQDKLNLEEQKKVNQKQKLVTYILGSVLLLLSLGIVFMIRSSRQKRLANQLLAIRSLRSQMNPHFIFNSLNSVNSFISKSDNRSANKYLTEFAKLMRMVLKHSQSDFIALEDELEVLERYLKLEHLRFSDQFEFELHIDESLEDEGLFIPPMLLQPYIENAIWHGLRYKKEKGLLKVHVHDDKSRVRFVIEDNGIGRDASKALKTSDQKSRESTGMSNTQSRIDLLNRVNNSNIEVSIVDLDPSNADKGTRVELCMPLQDMKEEKHAQFA